MEWVPRLFNSIDGFHLTSQQTDYVGAQNNREKVFWEFDSIMIQNMSHNLLLFCAPTWPSHHVIENHLYTRFRYLKSWRLSALSIVLIL